MNNDLHLMNLISQNQRVISKRNNSPDTFVDCVNKSVRSMCNEVAKDRLNGNHTFKNESTIFKKTYKRIREDDIKSNATLKADDGRSTHERNAVSEKGDAKKSREKDLACNTNRCKCANIAALKSSQGKNSDSVRKLDLKQATGMIEKALLGLSEKLKLNVSVPEEIRELENIEPSEAVLEQLAEILYTLEQIGSLLGNAGLDNVALDINGVMIEPDESEQLGSFLRAQLFNIEIALEKLGVAAEISQSVAMKSGKPTPTVGIPIASDPSTINMSQTELRQILGDLLHDSEEKIDAIVSKMKVLAEKTQEPRSQHFFVDADAEDYFNKKHGIDFSKDLTRFDPKVLRKLLHVDSAMSSSGDSQSDPKFDAKTSTFTNPQQSLPSAKLNPTLFQQLSNGVSLQDANLSMDDSSYSVQNAKADGISMLDGLTTKSTHMPSRTFEQAIMNQVTTRINMLVRSGVHEARIVLRPESLGDVKMIIQMDGEIVTARITVENLQVKQIIETNLQMLKDALEEQNLATGNFDVNVKNGSDRDGQDALQKNDGDDEKSLAADTLMDEENVDLRIGSRMDTGRRFGSNSVEYFG